MAKLHRLRVCIGYNNDNSAILKRISANSELELADTVVRTIFASERRNEFFAFPLSVTESQAPSFHDYASEWVTTYKIGKCKPSTIKGYNSILNEHLYSSFMSIRELRSDFTIRHSDSDGYYQHIASLSFQRIAVHCLQRRAIKDDRFRTILIMKQLHIMDAPSTALNPFGLYVHSVMKKKIEGNSRTGLKA